MTEVRPEEQKRNLPEPPKAPPPVSPWLIAWWVYTYTIEHEDETARLGRWIVHLVGIIAHVAWMLIKLIC